MLRRWGCFDTFRIPSVDWLISRFDIQSIECVVFWLIDWLIVRLFHDCISWLDGLILWLIVLVRSSFFTLMNVYRLIARSFFFFVGYWTGVRPVFERNCQCARRRCGIQEKDGECGSWTFQGLIVVLRIFVLELGFTADFKTFFFSPCNRPGRLQRSSIFCRITCEQSWTKWNGRSLLAYGV